MEQESASEWSFGLPWGMSPTADATAEHKGEGASSTADGFAEVAPAPMRPGSRETAGRPGSRESGTSDDSAGGRRFSISALRDRQGHRSSLRRATRQSQAMSEEMERAAAESDDARQRAQAARYKALLASVDARVDSRA